MHAWYSQKACGSLNGKHGSQSTINLQINQYVNKNCLEYHACICEALINLVIN